MRDLRQLRRSTGVALCLECGKCTTMCPLAGSEDFSAARLLSMRDPHPEKDGQGNALGRCLTCAACEVRCPQGVHYASFVRSLRGEYSESVPRKAPHQGIFESFSRSQARGVPGQRAVGLDSDLRIAAEGPVGLFVGCLPLFDLVLGEELGCETVAAVRGAIRILNALGIEPVLSDGEVCCGHDLLWSGDREGFEALARRNLEEFEKRGVEHLLTVCAECSRTWRLDYPGVGSGRMPKVEHLVEFLAPKIAHGELHLDRCSTRLTYQDPCRLGRHQGVFSAPRTALEAIEGVELEEMSRSGADALCCGTAGFIRCDSDSRRLQSLRLEEASATGAETLITACPKCLLHFRCAQTEDMRCGGVAPSLEIKDLTVFLAERLQVANEGADVTSQPSVTGGDA